MEVEFIPTLHVQRELYEQPRNLARFRWYVERLLGGADRGDDERDVQLPIMAVNPMGKEHCLDAVNALLAIDAESVAAAAAREAAARLPHANYSARVFVNVIDDLMGGWTNRIFAEFKNRYGDEYTIRANRKRRLHGVGCWTSARYAAEDIRWMACDALYRAAHWHTHGAPRTLREMLALDHDAAQFSGLREPDLSADDLEYTRAVLTPHLDASDQPTCIAALFGDETARSCGYAPLGLSARAGQALAAHGA